MFRTHRCLHGLIFWVAYFAGQCTGRCKLLALLAGDTDDIRLHRMHRSRISTGFACIFTGKRKQADRGRVNQVGNVPERNISSCFRFYYNLQHFDDDVAIQEYHHLVTKMPPQVSFRQAFASSRIRRAVSLGMIVSATQIFSGTMAAVSYSTS